MEEQRPIVRSFSDNNIVRPYNAEKEKRRIVYSRAAIGQALTGNDKALRGLSSNEVSVIELLKGKRRVEDILQHYERAFILDPPTYYEDLLRSFAQKISLRNKKK